MDHIKNGPYLLLKKDPTTQMKTKKFNWLNAMENSEFINNKLYYYLKANDSPSHRFYCHPKIHKPWVSMRPIVSYRGFPQSWNNVDPTLKCLLVHYTILKKISS